MDPKAPARTMLLELFEQGGHAGASDIHVTSGQPICLRVAGKLQAVDTTWTGDMVRHVIDALIGDSAQERLSQRGSIDGAVGLNSDDGELHRYRYNIFKTNGLLSIAFRKLEDSFKPLSELGLPNTLHEISDVKDGLVLIAGPTGSGKSTTLATLIDHINRTKANHIITIEDPIEFIHPHKLSIVNQREVGVDTDSYQDALENTLRQAPDVILIGEIRSRETMEHALAFAETGHLCLSTLHANNADQALDRIINFFPEERHKQLFTDISLNLQGIISQRLIPSVDGGRAAAVEILTGSPRMKDLIKAGKVTEIKEAMELSEAYGMQTFDMALLSLYKEERISEEEAIKNADSPNNLRLKLKEAKGFTSDASFELEVEAEPEEDQEDQEDEQDFGQVFSAS